MKKFFFALLLITLSFVVIMPFSTTYASKSSSKSSTSSSSTTSKSSTSSSSTSSKSSTSSSSSSSKSSTSSSSTSSKSSTSSSSSSSKSSTSSTGKTASPAATPKPSNNGGSVTSGGMSDGITSGGMSDGGTQIIYVTPPTPIPTPTPIPKLMVFNNHMVNELKDKPPIDMNVLKGDVEKYFNISKRIGRTFAILGLIASIVAILYSGDYFTSAKLKLTIRDFVFALFLLYTLNFWVSWAIEGSNLFYELWDTGNGFTVGILAAAGIGVIAAVANPVILIWVVVALALFFLYQVLMTSLIYLLQIAIILLPLFTSLFPIKTFKKPFLSIVSLIITILAIFPIQNLFVLLAKSTLLNKTLSMDSVAGLLGLLIIMILVIPGLAIGAFTKIFQLINNQ